MFVPLTTSLPMDVELFTEQPGDDLYLIAITRHASIVWQTTDLTDMLGLARDHAREVEQMALILADGRSHVTIRETDDGATVTVDGASLNAAYGGAGTCWYLPYTDVADTFGDSFAGNVARVRGLGIQCFIALAAERIRDAYEARGGNAVIIRLGELNWIAATDGLYTRLELDPDYGDCRMRVTVVNNRDGSEKEEVYKAAKDVPGLRWTLDMIKRFVCLEDL